MSSETLEMTQEFTNDKPSLWTKTKAGLSAFGGATKTAAARTHLGVLGFFSNRYERAQIKYTDPQLFEHQKIREQCLNLIKKMIKIGPGHKKSVKLLLNAKKTIYALENSVPNNINQYDEGLTREVRLGLSKQISRLEKDLEPVLSKVLYEKLEKILNNEESNVR